MKIVARSNFDNEMVNDVLVAENIVNETLGKFMVAGLNERTDDSGTYFYELVPDDYRLYEFQP